MFLLVLMLEPEYQLQNIVYFYFKGGPSKHKEGYWDSDHLLESEATLSVNVQLTYSTHAVHVSCLHAKVWLLYCI